MVEYSYLLIRLPRGTTRDVARQIVVEHAEHGGWELHLVRVFPDGSRRIQLRRKVIKATRTL